MSSVRISAAGRRRPAYHQGISLWSVWMSSVQMSAAGRRQPAYYHRTSLWTVRMSAKLEKVSASNYKILLLKIRLHWFLFRYQLILIIMFPLNCVYIFTKIALISLLYFCFIMLRLLITILYFFCIIFSRAFYIFSLEDDCRQRIQKMIAWGSFLSLPLLCDEEWAPLVDYIFVFCIKLKTINITKIRLHWYLFCC